ncbi:glycerate kinase [Caldisalinibacter kiritimatiensis]|uniref:Glycerate kinase n=1 Tax=Caldisalinibacter kiritimatiensis TaxID=1304284 RepID=R1AYN1_9FIRM|nr:glycerate kinase [Caldisalinibacter kiritimatiensis]EOD01812.1 Glycerate kinase [Caldisalinibacter kiritimatiensis]
MKIVIAPDSFKGSLTALEVAESIEKGIKNVCKDAEIVKVPMADGGEGTVKSLVDATKGEIVTECVTGPLGQKIEAFYGILGDRKTAVIEMAAASGLPLVPVNKRNPMLTTTYGTGELIKAALDKGCRKFIIGIGGSATNDGGAGMAQALGVRLLDKEGKEISFGGGELINLHKIDVTNMDKRLKESTFIVACDVDNPLCGPNGASYIYGPQKGATKEMVVRLDNSLKHFAQIVKKDLDKKVENIKGAGAAGGLGAGLVAFLDATLSPGIDIVIEATKLKEKIKDADLVITGEGKIDSQTINGKTPIGVAKIAKKFHIPVIAIAGCISDDAEINHEYGIDTMFSIINYPITVDEALKKEKASFFIKRKIEEIFRLIKLRINIERKG